MHIIKSQTSFKIDPLERAPLNRGNNYPLLYLYFKLRIKTKYTKL